MNINKKASIAHKSVHDISEIFINFVTKIIIYSTFIKSTLRLI